MATKVTRVLGDWRGEGGRLRGAAARAAVVIAVMLSGVRAAAWRLAVRLATPTRRADRRGLPGLEFAEYAVALAVVALVGMVALKAFGTGISQLFADILSRLRSGTQ
jgi:hypothetical protein